MDILPYKLQNNRSIEREHKLHSQSLRKQRATIDNGIPETFLFHQKSAKKHNSVKAHKENVIAYENGKMMDAMSRIMLNPLNQETPKFIRSKNETGQRLQVDKINKENKSIMKRLTQMRPYTASLTYEKLHENSLLNTSYFKNVSRIERNIMTPKSSLRKKRIYSASNYGFSSESVFQNNDCWQKSQSLIDENENFQVVKHVHESNAEFDNENIEIENEKNHNENVDKKEKEKENENENEDENENENENDYNGNISYSKSTEFDNCSSFRTSLDLPVIPINESIQKNSIFRRIASSKNSEKKDSEKGQYCIDTEDIIYSD